MARAPARSATSGPQIQRPAPTAVRGGSAAAPDASKPLDPAQVLALQRSAGNAATARVLSRRRRSWLRELLLPTSGYQPDDPDPAPRLKGDAREEARAKNVEKYWKDPAVAAEAFKELAETVNGLTVSFWGNAIPSESGLLEEVEDAFAGPAMSERSGPARDYARYIRARKTAAQAIFRVRLNKHLSTAALKQVWIAWDAPVPEAPPVEPSLEDDVVAYPGTQRDFERRTKELEVRLEAMRQLYIDKTGGGMKAERLAARSAELHDFLAVEFSHGPLPDKTKGSYAYERYVEARVAVARWALDQGYGVSPKVRQQMQSQADAIQTYFQYETSLEPDHAWKEIEHAAWHSGDAKLRGEAADFDAELTALLWKIENARRAVREYRQTTKVSPALAKTVQAEARQVFGTPPRAIPRQHAILRRFQQKYLIFRHEYARLVEIAKLTPADVAKRVKEEARAKLSAVRAITDPDAVDKAERDKGAAGNYAEYMDDFDLDSELQRELGLGTPLSNAWWDLKMRVSALESGLDHIKDTVRDRRAGDKPFWAEALDRIARDEFQTRPPAIAYNHLAITRKMKQYRELRHKFAVMLVKHKLVPEDISSLVYKEAGVPKPKPKAAK